MLRALVLVLFLLNGAYFAWSQGWLRAYGWGPTVQSEPHRLQQQINPEAIEIINESEARKIQAEQPQVVAASAAQASVCLQSGWIDIERGEALRSVLKTALPAQSWELQEVLVPERWIIYMGKYANVAEMDKKRAQLDSLHLTFEPLSNSTLAPGLSLGAFASQAQANTALEALAKRGVRTARVLQEHPEQRGLRLRLPEVNDSLQASLPAIRAALGGQALLVCPAGAQD
ncbi:MAG: sporulation-related protein [Comamonadaceae bacterium]|nr:MAG: sporulation-related protein [Comamonadaceae bacterium]